MLVSGAKSCVSLSGTLLSDLFVFDPYNHLNPSLVVKGQGVIFSLTAVKPVKNSEHLRRNF